ncbi:MAG: hypothetical protein H8D67_31650 [Deltaproteobacteria bacterium]|nr:hypothetical protein [Deltaproteobacteria bacterium]
MKSKLTPYLIDLVYNASLKSFWRKQALRKFLRECRISQNFLSTWSQDETKREFLDRLFAKLQSSDRGREAILLMAKYLADQKSFPDLEHWEDSEEKIREALKTVTHLNNYLKKQDEEEQSIKDRERTRNIVQEHQRKIKRSEADLQKLNDRLDILSTNLGTQKAGYDFQDWFFDLLDFSEIMNRRPYTHGGRQIDGSLTVSGTTYLVELKFTANQAGATDIDSFLKKVNDKADNTMGIMVSISGYSSVGVKEASGPKPPILLLDHSHLYLTLRGVMGFADVVERVRRHASQTGEAYLNCEKFGG